MNVENLKDLFIGVNKHGKNNVSVRNQIKNAFDADHALCIFPAGLVSRKSKGKLETRLEKNLCNLCKGAWIEKLYLYTLTGSFLLFFITYIRLGSFLELRQILKCSTFRMNYLNKEIKKSPFILVQAINGKEFHSELTDYKAAQEYKKKVYSIKDKTI